MLLWYIKALVKFYQFLTVWCEESRTRRMKRWSTRGKGNDEKERNTFAILSSNRSCENWLTSAFSFFSHPKFDRLNSGIDGFEFPEDPWSLLLGSSRNCIVTRDQSRKRDLIHSKFVPKRIFPWNSRSIKIWRLFQSILRDLDEFFLQKLEYLNSELFPLFAFE